MGRHSCCYKQKLRKGLWSPEEDEKLFNHITKYGHGCWSTVPKQAGLQRCGKSCRLRWINYLRPDLKRGTFSQQEENLIIELHALLGNRWSQIAAQLPGRTDNEIKNLWNSCIKKKLKQRGIDPNTHKPLPETCSDQISVSVSVSKPPLVPIERSSSKDSIFPTKELFLDQSIASNDTPSASRIANSMGYFNLPQLTYSPECSIGISMHQNPSLWSKFLDMNSEFDSNSISTSTGLKPMINLPLDNSLLDFQYWEGGNSSNNSCTSGNSGTGIELQSNNSLFDSGVLQWPNLSSDKEPEDLKWSEYLNGSISVLIATDNQGQAMYGGGIKDESQFSIDGLSTWHQNQQQQHLHASDFYGKEFQRNTSSFEKI